MLLLTVVSSLLLAPLILAAPTKSGGIAPVESTKEGFQATVGTVSDTKCHPPQSYPCLLGCCDGSLLKRLEIAESKCTNGVCVDFRTQKWDCCGDPGPLKTEPTETLAAHCGLDGI